MNIVLDTNVLVSALWSANSKPAAIVNAAISGRFTACYDYRILEEYTQVLHRPKFHFANWQIEFLLEGLTHNGISVALAPLPGLFFHDESERKFLETAKFCLSPLITGNLKHFPTDPLVFSVADFYERYFQ